MKTTKYWPAECGVPGEMTVTFTCPTCGFCVAKKEAHPSAAAVLADLREWLEANRAECDAACDRLSTAAASAFGETLAKMDELEREEGGQ